MRECNGASATPDINAMHSSIGYRGTCRMAFADTGKQEAIGTIATDSSNMQTFRLLRLVRRCGVAGISFLPIGLPTLDCLDSEIAKRFREVSGPAFIQGVNTAVLNPEDAESGLRQAAAALLEGLGGILETRTPSSLNGDDRS